MMCVFFTISTSLSSCGYCSYFGLTYFLVVFLRVIVFKIAVNTLIKVLTIFRVVRKNPKAKHR